MAFKLKSGNKVTFKNMGSSPSKMYDNSPAKQKVDPDAPGTPGKPGYEPPVKREDLDEKGKAIWDKLRGIGVDKVIPSKKDVEKKKIYDLLKEPIGGKKKKSPAKQYNYSEDVKTNIKSQYKRDKTSNDAKKDASVLDGTAGDKVSTNTELKEQNKSNKQDQRGINTDGGRRRTRSERTKATDENLALRGDAATAMEAKGEGKRGFSWKNAGMAALEGQGLMGAVRSGIGTGDYESTRIEKKQTKRAGKAERKTTKASQKADRKQARRNKVRKASDLSTGI